MEAETLATIPYDAPQRATLGHDEARALVQAITAIEAERETLFVAECAEGYDALDIAPAAIDRAMALIDPDTRFAIRIRIDGVLEYAKADGFAVSILRIGRGGDAEFRLSDARPNQAAEPWSPARTRTAFEALGFWMSGPQTEVRAGALHLAARSRRDPDAVRLAALAVYALTHRGPEARILAA